MSASTSHGSATPVPKAATSASPAQTRLCTKQPEQAACPQTLLLPARAAQALGDGGQVAALLRWKLSQRWQVTAWGRRRVLQGLLQRVEQRR